MVKAQETVLEIDLKALEHNFKYLKAKLNSKTNFLAVVKAFAYGSDAAKIANYLQDLNVDYFAVAYIDEGVALRKAGITRPILVLHPQAINFKKLLEYNLEPSLYNTKILNEFITVAFAEKQTDYPVHIKFNTGLNRLGFSKNDVDFIVTKLKETNTIKAKSIFSHLAASEDLDEKDFTENQINVFNKISEKFEKLIGYKPIRHICNTSGILNYQDAHLDMVRSGIGLYGFGNSEKESQALKPVATLKTIISQIHHIQKGESIGYNRSFKSNMPLKSATLPIGHADGVGRIYGNGNGYVTINGEKAPILGNVCMDMIMVNITDIDCKEGDEVIVFGNSVSAENLAASANTISYELVASISQRIKRIFIG